MLTALVRAEGSVVSAYPLNGLGYRGDVDLLV